MSGSRPQNALSWLVSFSESQLPTPFLADGLYLKYSVTELPLPVASRPPKAITSPLPSSVADGSQWPPMRLLIFWYRPVTGLKT